MQRNKKIFYLLIIYLLTISGYVFSSGIYSLKGVILLMLAFLMLLVYFLKPYLSRKLIFTNFSYLSILLLVLSVALTLVLYDQIIEFEPGIFIRPYYFVVFNNINKILLFIALLISLTYLKKTKNLKRRFWYLICIASILRLSVILISPSPYIDTFRKLQLSPLLLLLGKNPYSESLGPMPFIPNYSPYFDYLPGLLFLFLPSSLIFHDPRYTFIISDLATVILLYFILKKRSETLPLIFLYNPVSLLITWKFWIDPIIIFLFTLFLYLVNSRFKILAFLILGLATATRQNLLIIIPYLFKLLNFNFKRLFIYLVSFLIIVVPFFIWFPEKFIQNTITHSSIYISPRPDSLSLNSLIFNLLKINLPQVVPLSLFFFISVIIWFKMKKTLHSFILSLTIILFGIYLLGFYAFVNYYYFVSSLLILAITVIE